MNFENVNFSKKIRHPEFTDPFAITFAIQNLFLVKSSLHNPQP